VAFICRAIHNKVFIYLAALVANFNIEISAPQKQCTARWRLPRASCDQWLLPWSSHGPITGRLVRGGV